MIYNFKAENTPANLDFNIALQKDKRVYCFIGENGAGKTQLLETMARSIIYSHSLFHPGTDDYKTFYMRDGVVDILKGKKIRLPLNIRINDITIKDKNTDNWGETTIDQVVANSQNYSFDNPIVFIGAKNRGYAKNLDKDNVKIIGSKLDRFLNSFIRTYNQMNSLEIDESSVVDWFVSRLIINPNFVYGQSKTIDEVVAICKLLQELEPVKMENLLAQNTNGGYSIDMGFNEGKLFFSGIPFEKLSTGYISIIKIFQDIVDGYSSWRLDDNEEISQIPGLVFIDEIEAHLHPKWEQNIIPILKRHFPKTFFFIATHSPLIISTTEGGEAYELIREGQYIESRELGNPKAWYLADIYSEAFHVGYNEDFEKDQENIIKMASEYSNLVKDYTRNRSDEKKKEIECLYDRLNSIMPDSDPRKQALNNLKKLIV